MRLLFLILPVCFFVSCQKQKSKPVAFQGVWVESSLRLDTLDFEYGNLIDWSGVGLILDFRTNIYVDTVLNPNFPVSHSGSYTYYFSNDKKIIYLRNFNSSSTYFGTFTFTLSADLKRFIIDKFYNRRALPAVIEFVRIR
jgi:hypothetical protein